MAAPKRKDDKEPWQLDSQCELPSTQVQRVPPIHPRVMAGNRLLVGLRLIRMSEQSSGIG